MTRTEAINAIHEHLLRLSDEQVAALADMTAALVWPSVYAAPSIQEKAEINAALDELDAGKGECWHTVRADLDARIAART